ncbi:MAG: phosphodiester glycosidase family protein [Pseudomonadota bacterium]
MLTCLLLAPPSMAADKGPCEEGLKNGKKKTVMEGITFYRQECETPLYKAHILEVDLTSQEYEFFVTPYKQRLLVPSKFADRFNAVAAVNGGFWCEKGGFTVSDGAAWPKFADTGESTVVGFGKWKEKTGRIKIDIRPTEEKLTAPPSWMKHALTGVPVILDKGKPLESDDEIFKSRHPRTGIGYTKDESKVFIVVVDGRQKGWSQGMKTVQLGELFLSLGAYRALNLDGGASSTMVVPSMGGVVNRTCHKKGPERNVSNHLGIVRTGNKGGSKGKAKSPLEKVLAFLFPVDLLRKSAGLQPR